MRSSPHSFSPFTKYQKYPLGVNSKVTHHYKSPNVTNFHTSDLSLHFHFLSPLTNSLNSIFIFFIFFISAMSRNSQLPSSAFISMSGQIAQPSSPRKCACRINLWLHMLVIFSFRFQAICEFLPMYVQIQAYIGQSISILGVLLYVSLKSLLIVKDMKTEA